MPARTPHYLIEDAASGLPVALGEPRQTPAARLTSRREASRFATRADALIALCAAGLGGEALEVVQVRP